MTAIILAVQSCVLVLNIAVLLTLARTIQANSAIIRTLASLFAYAVRR